jgi:DNA-directed RNA polymerase specialized sigma subunit
MSHRKDTHFLDFIGTLEEVLAGHGKNTDQFQKDQVNDLLGLERDFRKALVKHRWGPDVYKAFIRHITVEKRNILMARPYFRQRNDVFKGYISKTLRDENWRGLFRFNINFQFVKFAMGAKKWNSSRGSKTIIRLAKKIERLRADLVECNLPLAISQARIFYGSNPNTHLSYMDMVQTAAEGLIAAVDKFCGPYSKVFRAVAVGRMLGNAIEANSETSFHFYPREKKRIYRARKLIGQLNDGSGHVDLDAVLAALNRKETEEEDELTTATELAHLISASQVVFASALPLPDEEEEHHISPIEQFADEDGPTRPDFMYEDADLRHRVANAIKGLSIFDQKLVRMKGVEF